MESRQTGAGLAGLFCTTDTLKPYSDQGRVIATCYGMKSNCEPSLTVFLSSVLPGSIVFSKSKGALRDLMGD